MIGSLKMHPWFRNGKFAGLFYLIFIVTFPLASYMRSQLISYDDTAATVDNITANELLFRTAFITEIISALFFLLAAWALFLLLEPVNKSIAMLFLLLNLSGVAIECMNMAYMFSAIVLLGGAGYLTAIPADQLQAQVMFNLDMYRNGFIITQIFFGTWLLPLGYLVYRSGFLPRALGIVLVLDFFGIVFWFFQYFLLPDYPVLSYPGFAVSFIAEVSLTIWLLVKGVKDIGQYKMEAG